MTKERLQNVCMHSTARVIRERLFHITNLAERIRPKIWPDPMLNTELRHSIVSAYVYHGLPFHEGNLAISNDVSCSHRDDEHHRYCECSFGEFRRHHRHEGHGERRLLQRAERIPPNEFYLSRTNNFVNLKLI